VNALFSWISQNYIEVLGAVTGLIYLYFSIKQIIWLWPLGIITSVLYIYVFYTSKFYADMSLQVYYFFVSIYGWYHWKKGSTGKELPVITASWLFLVLSILVSGLLTLVIGYILKNYTDSPFPYLDAFTTAGSIVATWMLARKYLEQWIFWIIIDLVSMGMYIYKDLYPTAGLFLVYTTMAWIGYKQWKRDLIITEVS